MKSTEFISTKDTVLEAYLNRWDAEVTKPLLEWQRMLAEAKLSPEQINALFGDVVTRTADLKTTTGKVAGVAGKAAAKGANLVSKVLPGAITSNLHDLIKDTKPVKDFDAAFERAKTNLVNKLGRDDSKVVQYITQYAAWGKRHPILQSAIIGLLTTAAAVLTSPLGAGGVGLLLKTANELLKGQTLSGSLLKGAGAGIVGMIAGLGIKELAHLIGDPMVRDVYIKQTAADPGINLSSSRSLVEIKGFDENGKSVVKKMFLDIMGTPDEIEKINRTLEKVQDALNQGDTETASKLMDTLDSMQAFPKSIQAVINDVSDDGKEKFTNWVRNFTGKQLENQMEASAAVMQVATDFENKVHLIQQGLEAAAQGAGTAASNVGSTPAAPKSAGNAASVAAATRKLSEADIKGIASSIANWAKTQASQYTQQITPEKLSRAWRDAGSPDDSNALHGILLKAGVPATVLATAYNAQNIPVPRGQSMTKDAIRKRQARAQGRVSATAATSTPASASSIKTSNAALDSRVNAILAKDGKDAAMKYLNDLKTSAQTGPKIKTQNSELDAQVNAILADRGKEAAMKYLQDLKAVDNVKTKNQIPPAEPASTPAATRVQKPTVAKPEKPLTLGGLKPGDPNYEKLAKALRTTNKPRIRMPAGSRPSTGSQT